MRRVVSAGIVACLTLGGAAVSARQAAPGISWAKSLGQAMNAMGADDRPVILYFTYDT